MIPRIPYCKDTVPVRQRSISERYRRVSRSASALNFPTPTQTDSNSHTTKSSLYHICIGESHASSDSIGLVLGCSVPRISCLFVFDIKAVAAGLLYVSARLTHTLIAISTGPRTPTTSCRFNSIAFANMSPPAPLDVDLRGDSDVSSVPVPDPLTVDTVPDWRSRAPQMPIGVAAGASSDMFKSPVCLGKS